MASAKVQAINKFLQLSSRTSRTHIDPNFDTIIRGCWKPRGISRPIGPIRTVYCT